MNIPQMIKIIRYHGLVPIPIEIDVEGLSPKVEEIEAAITPKSKVKNNFNSILKILLLAALFGTKINNMDEIAQLCKKHNLLLIEDMAEGFQTITYNGHPMADMSLFSFGTIKTLSALGGGLMVLFYFILFYLMDCR